MCKLDGATFIFSSLEYLKETIWGFWGEVDNFLTRNPENIGHLLGNRNFSFPDETNQLREGLGPTLDSMTSIPEWPGFFISIGLV